MSHFPASLAPAEVFPMASAPRVRARALPPARCLRKRSTEVGLRGWGGVGGFRWLLSQQITTWKWSFFTNNLEKHQNLGLLLLSTEQSLGLLLLSRERHGVDSANYHLEMEFIHQQLRNGAPTPGFLPARCRIMNKATIREATLGGSIFGPPPPKLANEGTLQMSSCPATLAQIVCHGQRTHLGG